MNRFRVGLDNYCLHPLGLDPLQTLEWAKNHGAQGVQFSGLEPRSHAIADPAYLKDLAAAAKGDGMYLEWGGGQHIPRDTGTWARKDLRETNRIAAKQAGILDTRIVRSCSGGMMRWRPESPMTETLLEETAAALLEQKQMLLDHNVILAIETHFEFTSFELVRLLERCEAAPGSWLGICLDVMNLLTMLEDPVCATRRLLPWVVSTHMKDGGLQLAGTGLVSFPVPMGKGVVDMAAILRLLRSIPADVSLSVEGHGGSFQIPIFDSFFLSRFPDLTAAELSKLLQLTRLTEDQEASGCRPVERERWPEVCEQRTASDLAALWAIASASI